MIIEVTPFILDCTEKEQACKVLEEAAEVFGQYQCVEACEIKIARDVALLHLADEIADVIQAACNLAERYGIDVGEAMQRCTRRQQERGRI